VSCLLDVVAVSKACHQVESILLFVGLNRRMQQRLSLVKIDSVEPRSINDRRGEGLRTLLLAGFKPITGSIAAWGIFGVTEAAQVGDVP